MGVETEIKELLQQWADAIRVKDADALAECYEPNVRSFDLASQMDNFAELRHVWESCFPYFGETIGTEREAIKVATSDDLAVATFYSRLTGIPGDHPSMRAWMRSTVCFRRGEDGWKIFHDHISMPVDCAQEKPIYLFEVADAVSGSSSD